MAEWLAMGSLHRLVQPGQKPQTFRRDPSHHRSPVLGFTAARDQFTLFQSVEQSIDIRVPGNHPAGNFTAKKPVRRAPQNSQQVVLCWRESLTLEEADQPPRQHVSRADEFQKRRLLGTSDAPLSFTRSDRLLHLTLILLVVTTIVKTTVVYGWP